MKKEIVEQYIGKQVEITMFDNDIICGELHETSEERFKNEPNLFYKKNFYFLTNPQSFLFRSSHIKAIKI